MRMNTATPVPSRGACRCGKRCGELADRVRRDDGVDLVAFFEHANRSKRRSPRSRRAARQRCGRDRPPRYRRRACRRRSDRRSAESEVSLPRSKVCVLPGRLDQHVANHLRADGRRADRLHAELAVHLSARRIVDARDDPLDLEHALGDQGRHDVAVVAVGDGDKSVGGLPRRLA